MQLKNLKYPLVDLHNMDYFPKDLAVKAYNIQVTNILMPLDYSKHPVFVKCI